MKEYKNKTIEEFLTAYSDGKRYFHSWDFEEDGSVYGIDLTGVFFEECFLFLNFRNSNLTNSKFIKCNIKTADFRGANLTNALIENCSVESTMFNGAIADNITFKENYYYGKTVGQFEFENFLKDTDEFFSIIKLNNGFPNTGGSGNILTGILLTGEISKNDLLILTDGTEIPIIEVEYHNVIPGQRNFAITIPRTYDNVAKWHQLYGAEIKIKKKT